MSVIFENKDKRRKSSSSLISVAADETGLERKVDVRASIPELDDNFTLAESRCEELQKKLDIIRDLKKKRKQKKRRSVAPILDGDLIEVEPLESGKTPTKIPLRRVQQALQARGYVDPATVEQHRMIETVQQLLTNAYTHPHADAKTQPTVGRNRARRASADGDSMTDHQKQEAHCHEKETDPMNLSVKVIKKPNILRKRPPLLSSQRRHVPKEANLREVVNTKAAGAALTRHGSSGASVSLISRRVPPPSMPTAQKLKHNSSTTVPKFVDDRNIVELFSKDRRVSSPLEKKPGDWKKQEPMRNKQRRDYKLQEEEENNDIEKPTKKLSGSQVSHRLKYQSRGYELPTVASKMKQTTQRWYCGNTNSTNIPFIVSKSTAPSHNIAVNIQQVLNGLKIQQPLSGIPLTIAHHMGLGHLPYIADLKTGESVQQRPSLDSNEINVIRVGQQQVHLPSYKNMSYNQLLRLYRKEGGFVSRFLRTVSRQGPARFYTSMYNLAWQDNEILSTKGVTQETKQSLAEYRALFHEYEKLDKALRLGGGGDEAMKRRRDEMAHELAMLEEHIRWGCQQISAVPAEQPLRASASTAMPSSRYSALRLDDTPQ